MLLGTILTCVIGVGTLNVEIANISICQSDCLCQLQMCLCFVNIESWYSKFVKCFFEASLSWILLVLVGACECSIWSLLADCGKMPVFVESANRVF